MDKFGPGSAVAIDIPMRDGSVSMVTGRIVTRDDDHIVLSEAAYIADTGRRSQFFAGHPDDQCEIEIYMDEIQIPAEGVIVYAWPHPLPRTQI